MRLSGGQVQRTAAARMFVRDAELLVFDDLSSALDVETERMLWERLFAERRARPCWPSRTAGPALRRADQIVVLDDGRVVAQRAAGRPAGDLGRDAPALARVGGVGRVAGR